MDKNQLIELVVNPNNIVTKSNRMIEAEYSMTPMEFKVVQTVFSNIQPNSPRGVPFKFPIRQFMDMLDLKGESGYSHLKKTTLSLFKPIQITVDGETKQLSWFQLVNYNEKEGTITIEVNSFWHDFLYSLDGNFTSYKLFNITHLSSSYSPRLYELLKMRVGLNSEKEYSIKELKAKLGIEDGKYPKFGNFKQRVLIPAQKELKEQSDIYFEFKEIKHGRATTHLRFFIYRNARNKIIEPQVDVASNTHTQLLKYGFTKEKADELLGQYAEERILANINYMKVKKQTSNVNNDAAYLITAIEKDYANSTTKRTNYDKFDEDMAKKNKNDHENVEEYLVELSNKTPEEFEITLLNIIEIRKKLNSTEETIHKDLIQNLTNYQVAQEKIKGTVILPKKFKDPLIKKLCKEVIVNLS